MIEIIPTILVKDFKEVKERIKKVENFVNWIQLDVMDGVFVDNKIWPYTKSGKGNPEDLKSFKTRVKLEAHLMIQKPENVINDWMKVIDRIIIHYESKIDNKNIAIQNLIKKIHQKNKQIGLAINPDTPINMVMPFLKELDLVLIMTVQPGLGGQEFQLETLEKVKALRKIWPSGNIAVDGGINPKSAKIVVQAGANILCSGSYIFKSKNIKMAIDELRD